MARKAASTLYRRLLTVAVAMLTSGCLAITTFPASDTGSAISGVDLSDVSLTIGSKEFTEQLILGQIAGQALAAAGAKVSDQTGLVGTTLVRESLKTGQIDLYWEYTGTGWITHLGHVNPIPDPRKQWKAVHDEDLKANGIWWFPPTDVNNSYGFALKEQDAKKMGVRKISDISTVPQSQMSLCAASEFLGRVDGLPGVEKTYGFEFPDSKIHALDYGLIYTSVGGPCTFGEIFTTDGRIRTENLYVLEDDKNFFAKYNVSVTMRDETYRAHADEYDKLFAPIIKALDNDTMIEMNAQVDVGGRGEEVV
ncbi:MAG: glycine/betaine ABC transporter substrate-binding protein, partial [Actinomycetota bacterium]|nr:glycine/betaine ABC transporter substrate-binding protein [Actinomycetota bacterium]